MKKIDRWLGLRNRTVNDFRHLKVLNSKKIALQVLVGDSSLQTMPQWVSFSTTTLCNLKCPHCQTHGTEETRTFNNGQHWPHDLTLRVAAETLPTADGFCLTLTGEPLATPRLLDLLAKLQPYGAKLHLTTNGILMSKKVLIQLLPLVSAIHISIDGGTKEVVEAIRLGIKFEKLLNRIRILTRSCELLRDVITPPIRFAFTVMGSNIRDMPEVIRLAHILGVQGVDFYPLYVFYPNVSDESVDFYVPLYKAYYQRTQKEAKKWGIDVNFLLPLFSGISSNPDFSVERKKLLVSLPINYYDTLPSPESFLDKESIESEAAEIAASVLAGILPSASAPLLHDFTKFLHDYKHQLREWDQSPDIDIPWCVELYTRIFINPNGEVAPCCMPGRPVFGNIHKETVTQIWNGPNRAAFWQDFHSSSQPDCCNNCRTNTRVSRRSLLKLVMPETILSRFFRL